jgi:hypothetical protein
LYMLVKLGNPLSFMPLVGMIEKNNIPPKFQVTQSCCL